MVAVLSSERRRVSNIRSLSIQSTFYNSPFKNSPEMKKRKWGGDRVARKYRKAAVKKAEYRRLKAIVPSVSKKRSVSKLKVIEEAIKYIDQLHSALAHKVIRTNTTDSSNKKEKRLKNADDFVKQLCYKETPQNETQQQQHFQQQQIQQNKLMQQQYILHEQLLQQIQQHVSQQTQQQLTKEELQQKQQEMFLQHLLHQQQRVRYIQDYKKFQSQFPQKPQQESVKLSQQPQINTLQQKIIQRQQPQTLPQHQQPQQTLPQRQQPQQNQQQQQPQHESNPLKSLKHRQPFTIIQQTNNSGNNV